MQSKKGLYLLLAFIGTILLFFGILFFVHEKTLENGILFTVSFNYENAQDITYNFYNQSGKIEKVEVGEGYQNSLFLEKTDYKSIKLLRKILKGLKERKEKPTEEGLTIYNGKNKRYYLLPFDKETAEELANLIIDGYIHEEMVRLGKKEKYNELYLYESNDTILWTKDGSKQRIIHTYQCSNETCEGIYSDKENNEKVLLDQELYLYNYVTKSKEQIKTEETVNDVKFIKWDNQLIGLELINKSKETAFYDLAQTSLLTKFQKHEFKLINDQIILEIKKEEKKFNVWNRFTKEILWNYDKLEEEKTYQIIELKNEKATYYLLEKEKNNAKTYQILNANWNFFLDQKEFNDVKLKEDGMLLVGKKQEDQLIYEQYDLSGNKVSIEENEIKN